MKNVIGVILSILAGCLVGFFGVLVSVFADGMTAERLTTVAVVLLVYAILSGTWGYLLPKYSWKWGILIGIPGVLCLGVYMLREYSHYYWAYMILILCVACLSAWGGSRVKK